MASCFVTLKLKFILGIEIIILFLFSKLENTTSNWYLWNFNELLKMHEKNLRPIGVCVHYSFGTKECVQPDIPKEVFNYFPFWRCNFCN